MSADPDQTDEPSIDQLQNHVGNPVWRLVSTYCRPYLHFIGLSILAMLIAQGLWLFPPIVLGVAFDAVFLGSEPYQLPFIPTEWIPGTPMGQLWFSLGLFAVAYGGATVIYAVAGWARNIAAYRVQHDLRTDAYGATQDLDFGFFDNQQTGELLSILNNDVNQLEGFLRGTLQQAANATFIVLGVGCYMLLLNWQLALVAFVAPLFGLVINVWYSRYVEQKHETRREEVGGINTRIENNLGGMRLVKVYNQESNEEARVTDASETYKEVSWMIARARVLYVQVSGLLTNIGYMLIFLVGGSWVLLGPPSFFSGSLAAGTVLTFLIYNGRFSWPLRQVTNIIDSYQETRAAGGRVLGLLDESRSVPERAYAIALEALDGQVEFDDVTFTYDGAEESSLDGVSFEATVGEMIGLVGPTGAGKSTMMKLLLRFYDVDDGTIRVDGHDVRDLTLESLRKGISYVGQEPYLFDGSIRENIAYSRPDADDASIEEAARRAGADEFIHDLPDGYETPVGERGVKLSGGQRQRISIARAVLDDPDILILDEATSHVDNETEAIIHSRLEDIVANRTTFAVAHRLSTVRHADQILVIEDGEIVEYGTHEDLLNADGLYANLWNVQVGEVDSLPEEFVQRVA